MKIKPVMEQTPEEILLMLVNIGEGNIKVGDKYYHVVVTPLSFPETAHSPSQDKE